MEYPDFRLDNQVALVTGASMGIGYGLAKALAHAGAKVAEEIRAEEGLHCGRERVARLMREADLRPKTRRRFSRSLPTAATIDRWRLIA